MKLVHPEVACQLCLDCQKGCEWIIESPQLFAKYVGEMIEQTEGGEGNFVLSENGKEMNISKCLEVIVNPFSVNVNDKKILNRLYSELSELANGEALYMATQEIKGKLQNYFMELEQLSSYMLEIDREMDITALFKAIGVQVEDSSEDFFENLVGYIKLIVELLGKKVIVLINIRSYITDAQLEELLKTAIYNEVALLLVENRQRDFSNIMNRYIIDSDQCEIF